MQATIRIKLSEMNAGFIERLRQAFKQISDSNDPEVDIVLSGSGYPDTFCEVMENSKLEMEEGRSHLFSMNSLREFARKQDA